MADQINYNFNENAESIREVGTILDGLTQAREDITNVFKDMSDAYGGEGFEALHAKQMTIDGRLDELIGEAQQMQRAAQQQQDDMQALDKSHASAF